MSYILGLITGLAGMFIIATFVVRRLEKVYRKQLEFYKQGIEKFDKWFNEAGGLPNRRRK